MRSLLLPLTILLALTASVQAATRWDVDPVRSKLAFTALQGSEKIEGGFSSFRATVLFSPNDLRGSKIDVEIDTGSAFAGAADRDRALPGKDWFDVAQFPQAHFTTQTIDRLGDNEFQANGILTIRAVQQPVSLPFTLTEEDGVTHASGELAISRDRFGVGQGEFATNSWIKFPVKIKVDIYAMPQK